MRTWVSECSMVMVIVLGISGSARADAPPLRGKTPCPWGSPGCNTCVADVVGSMARLRSHGDILGFHMNGAPDVFLDPHWQGVQRLTGGGGRYLAVSRSVSSENVSFVVVRMESRNAEGERFRSNRLDPDLRTFETPPPLNDGIAVVVPRDPGFNHAGGLQVLGNILAVPLEGGAGSKITFYDVANPEAPVKLAAELDHSGLSDEAGAVFLARLADDRILLGIGRSNSNILDFYASSGPDLNTAVFTHFDTWHEDELAGGDSEFGNYQSLNAVTQCDGSLFLIGTHEDTTVFEDFADAFRVDNGAGSEVVITKVAKRHLFCAQGVQHCNLDAAGGVYVDPSGELYVYGTEHDNDGPLAGVYPCTGPACSVKFAEFRPVPHGACSVVGDAWVELYDDDHFGDRSLMIDYRDRLLEDYSNYDRAEGFEDKGSSVRWCLPPGVTYRLWQDKGPCGGDFLDLAGTGMLESIANLDDVGFGDDASCSEWLGGPFADAGPDRTVECVSPQTTPVALDGRDSSDVQGDLLQFSWSGPGITFDDPHSSVPVGAFPKGTSAVTLSVTDGTSTGTDTMQVSVVDTTAPVVTCPAPATVECRAAGGTPSSDDGIATFLAGAAAQDVCDSTVTIDTDAPAHFPIGSTPVTFTARDDDLNASACSAVLTVADTIGPAVDAGFSVTPSAVEVPNHALVPIDVSGLVVTDACGGDVDVFCSVTSSEAADARGDGRTAFDIVLNGQPYFGTSTGVQAVPNVSGVGTISLQVRAERAGGGDGRVYTVSCFGVDAAGNQGLAAVATVVVAPRMP